MDQLLDQVLRDRYHIQSLLGRKTGRRTFLASDRHTQSPVVIKLLLLGPDFVWEDLKLFEREAETLQSLDHPAIPKYLDSFEVETELGKGFALVQSYLDARSLQTWVERGRHFSEAELKTLAQDLLEILDYLHRRNPPVIHRDIKPSNILLSDRSGNSPGNLYLVDFGSVQTSAPSGTITVVGTYGYMPPEQFGGRAVPASDLYSLGATLIYLATGQHPADLPCNDLQLEFEPYTQLSPPLILWLQYLTNPALSKRPASASAALQSLQHLDEQGTVAAKPPFSLVRETPTNIQLQKTATSYVLEVPAKQITISIPKQQILTKLEWLIILSLGAIGFLSGPSIFFALVVFSSVYFTLKQAFFVTAFNAYTVHLQKRGNSVYFSITGSTALGQQNTELFAEERLTLISAGPRTPVYQLNMGCNKFGDVFHITGRRAEIQWLCDELNDWIDLDIEYKDSTPA